MHETFAGSLQKAQPFTDSVEERIEFWEERLPLSYYTLYK